MKKLGYVPMIEFSINLTSGFPKKKKNKYFGGK